VHRDPAANATSPPTLPPVVSSPGSVRESLPAPGAAGCRTTCVVSEGLRLRGNIAEPVEGEAADSDRDAGASGRGAGADARITGMGAVLY